MSVELLRVLDEDGALVGTDPALAPEDLRRLYRHMLKMRVLDQRMLSLQRQGRVGFYGTATGEEAAVTGSAFAMRPEDWVFPALRQMGVSLWRGTTVTELVCQLIGNSGDVLIGRQMPCHFSDRKVNTVAWSSVIGTQLPHAMGAAWAAKLKGDDVVCMGYLGDGASSVGDFHAAANFAGVMKLPVVFFCQNNQWAISVPLSKQTGSESIAIKANAYGFPGVRVDGNDVLAVIVPGKRPRERVGAPRSAAPLPRLAARLGGHRRERRRRLDRAVQRRDRRGHQGGGGPTAAGDRDDLHGRLRDHAAAHRGTDALRDRHGRRPEVRRRVPAVTPLP